MTIAIDARAAQEKFGGIPSYTRAIVRNLVQAPSSHTFVLFANSFTSRELDGLNWKSNSSVVRFRIPNKLLSSSICAFGRPYLDTLVEKRFGKKIDLWFSPNLNFTSLSKKCPHIITAHDLSFEHYPKFYPKKSNFWHRAVRPRKTFLKATHIIAVSESTKNDLISTYSVLPDKISVVHHGIDCAYKETPRIAREQLDVGQQYILIAAASSARKNLENCIEAFHSLLRTDSRFRGLKLIVTGTKKQSKGDVRHTGFVSQEIYHALLYYAEALVYPSFYEGFGLPMIEAFAAGTAVIASANSSLSEIGNDAFYPVDPYNTESIARAIASVITDKETRGLLKARGLKRAEMFSWEMTAAHMLSIFETCASV